MKLGDMGAEVIKIEEPGKGDETRRSGPPFVKGESAYYLSINRNKKSVTVDIASPDGVRIIRKLIKRCDVLVENFRPGVLSKLRIGYRHARAINPKIIYCSITGYGQTTSWRNRRSYELLIQGESGLMDMTGFPTSPPTKVGISLSDVNAGNIAFEAILLALIQRQQTGAGTYLDISLLDSLLSLFTYQAQILLSSTQSVTRMGNEHPTITPYETFRTNDGFLNIAVASDRTWSSFCRALQRPDLSPDKRFATNAMRIRYRASLRRILAPILRRRSTAAWLKRLQLLDVPAGNVNRLEDALLLPPVKERNMVISTKHPTIGDLRLIGNPLRFSGRATPSILPPPLLGQHTGEILRQIGYSEARILRLRREGSI